ncbi:MAG: aerolysin family beta-barrel pore-forming toxin [Bacteroidales bacterium]
MKNASIALLASVFLGIATSCSEHEFSEMLNKQNIQQETLILRKTKSLIEGQDSIIQFKGERDKKAVVYSNYSIWEDLYNIRELPINIIAKENIQGGGRFLTTQGAGSELTLEQHNNNLNQKFYIKILPASTGIPYLIYSQATNTPLAIGAYSSTPNTKVLYALPEKFTSYWGASWDFLQGSTDGFLAIENQDILGGGPNYWEMYNLAMKANNVKVTFDQYRGLGTQQFEIAPIETYQIQSIQYINDATATLSHKPKKVLFDGYKNNGPIMQKFTLQISEQVSETSSFTDKSSFSLNVSTTNKLKVPIFAEGSISTSITSSSEFSYSNSDSQSRQISRSYPVDIPAGHRADLTVTLFEDIINMDYIATCRGLDSGRIITIKGKWNGVSVSQSEATLDITPLNGKNIVKSYIFNEKTNSWRIKN